MRAITDWYFTAHPPIMHDLHEAQPLMYTYSGGPPQNPNLDPILFAELPLFANCEMAQMTKWGMPGVYTHAFMDGWSPGYLGSVAYNHNGMMRMYETQSGREAVPARGGGGERATAAVRRSASRGSAAASRRSAARSAPAHGCRRGGGRGAAVAADRPRRRAAARVVSRHSDSAGRSRNFSRRNNTNYMETGVLSALQLTSMFPNSIVENFYHEDAATRSRPGRHEAAVRLRDSRCSAT